MDISLIRKILKNKKFNILDSTQESAVVVPIIKIDNQSHILFEVRSLSLNSQPGEICFPGGKIEENESPLSCAIRETSEELNVSKSDIEIIGELDILSTQFNMTIYSYCGILNNIEFDSIKFNKHEVESVFSVPINYLLNQNPISSNMTISLNPPSNFPFHLIEKGEKYKWKSGIYPVYFYKYKEYIIWGITAKILKNFLDTLK